MSWSFCQDRKFLWNQSPLAHFFIISYVFILYMFSYFIFTSNLWESSSPKLGLSLVHVLLPFWPPSSCFVLGQAFRFTTEGTAALLRGWTDQNETSLRRFEWLAIHLWEKNINSAVTEVSTWPIWFCVRRTLPCFWFGFSLCCFFSVQESQLHKVLPKKAPSHG